MGKFVRGNFVGGRHIDSSVVSVKSRGRMRKDRYNDSYMWNRGGVEMLALGLSSRNMFS